MRLSRSTVVVTVVALVAGVFLGAAAPKTSKPAGEPPPRAAEKAEGEPAAKPDEQPADEPKRTVRVVEIPLQGEIEEQAALAMPFQARARLLRHYTATLRKAATDSKVEGILLRLGQPAVGLAKLQELMDAIGEVQAAGKKVYAYVEATGNGGYLLAASADEVCAAPGAMVMLVGLRAEAMFIKGLLDWAGIQAHFLAFGKHKSAADMFTRESMSEENRRVLNEYLDDVYGQFVAAIAEGRKLPAEAVRAAIDNGPHTAPSAKEAGLVDDVAYYDQFLDRIGKALGGKVEAVRDYHHLGKKGPDLAQMNLFSLFAALKPQPDIPATSRPKVVILYASGMIAFSRPPFIYGNLITAEALGKAFERARSDDTVKAVVLRVDSPGGSALVSDLIWREVKRTQEKGKPVIASMSDVAGSGGYYIAMQADAIVAQPATVTGSIGVVGGKLSLRGLYDKIGVKKEVFTRGRNATLFSDYSGFSEGERQRIRDLMAGTYNDFVEKAAAGRKMPVEKMRELATGRIWTGRAAQQLGLVDELGGLKEAYELAIRKAGLEGKDVQPVILPREKSFLEALFQPMALGDGGVLGSPVPATAARAVPVLQLFDLLRREHVLTVMPYWVEVQ